MEKKYKVVLSTSFFIVVLVVLGMVGLSSLTESVEGLHEVTTWMESEHADSYDEGIGANTYCASCKAPFQFVIGSTRDNNDPVPEEEWEDIVCNVCHPPAETGLGLVGFYDANIGDWVPADGNTELCVKCHTGGHHYIEFVPGPGKNMEKKGVGCSDCHMPVIGSDGEYKIRSHTWEMEESKQNPVFSCGMLEANCHPNKDAEWAAKSLEQHVIHLVGGHEPGGE